MPWNIFRGDSFVSDECMKCFRGNSALRSSSNPVAFASFEEDKAECLCRTAKSDGNILV